MLDEGADIIDVGGESTRPGADEVDAAEEIGRVVPVIQRIVAVRPHAEISIDTSKAAVARAAIEAGATIVNDISGLGFDPAMATTVADLGVPVILMHIRGTPRTMQRDPRYDDVVAEIRQFLAERIELAVAAGIAEDKIVVDPGIGFGKTLEHNLEILRRLDELTELGRPILIGTSRKSFIGTLTRRERPAERVFGTAATHALAIAGGADILRAHDVRAAVDVARVTDAITRQALARD
jgi:dihydropteroate synthase